MEIKRRGSLIVGPTRLYSSPSGRESSEAPSAVVDAVMLCGTSFNRFSLPLRRRGIWPTDSGIT